jgi:hypothetical protein
MKSAGHAKMMSPGITRRRRPGSDARRSSAAIALAAILGNLRDSWKLKKVKRERRSKAS